MSSNKLEDVACTFWTLLQAPDLRVRGIREECPERAKEVIRAEGKIEREQDGETDGRRLEEGIVIDGDFNASAGEDGEGQKA